tara:strand:- start:321 stop:524 length:204 start_codon:yes stop_codon:yes gene_type:complete
MPGIKPAHTALCDVFSTLIGRRRTADNLFQCCGIQAKAGRIQTTRFKGSWLNKGAGQIAQALSKQHL